MDSPAQIPSASSSQPAESLSHGQPESSATSRVWFGRPYGVTRRYSLAALLTLFTGFAALFGLLTRIGLHPLGILIFALFTAGVGAAQAFLFGGRRPRAASLLAGEILGVLAVPAMGAVPLLELHGFKWPNWLLDRYLELFIWCLPYSIALGPILGYVAGGVMAGLFLILDRTEAFWGGPTSEQSGGVLR